MRRSYPTDTDKRCKTINDGGEGELLRSVEDGE